MTIYCDDPTGDALNGLSSDNDTLNERIVLKILNKDFGLNASELATRVDKSIPTVKRYIMTLTKLGLIEFKGAKKTRGYFIIEKPNNK